MQVTEINQDSEFYKMKDQWDSGLKRSIEPDVFLTWDFLSTFWKYFGENHKLRILMVEDKGELLAIAPLRQRRYGGFLGYNVIEPLGYHGGDYTGLLLTEKKTEYIQAIMDYLYKNGDWNFLYLYDLHGASSIPSLFQTPNGSKYNLSIVKCATCPYIPLPKTENEFLGTLDTGFKKNNRRCLRNLEKDLGKVEFKKHDELGSVPEAMDIFFSLHQNRWTAKSMSGNFDNKHSRDFWCEAAQKMADNGWLNLYFLTVNDKPVATQYCLEYGNKMYYVLGGFDVSYFKYSVGSLLTSKIIQECISKKISEFDFLKGDEEYKFNWTKQYRQNIGVRIVNKNLTSRLYNRGINSLKRMGISKFLEKN